MNDSDPLQTALQHLRSDPELRNNVSSLVELLNRERGFTSSSGFIAEYERLVVQSLHRLGNEHLSLYYRSKQPAAVLVSYNSSVVGFGKRDRRITDWIPDQLGHDNFSAGIASHAKTVIKREWLEKASKITNVLELHLLAQNRISVSGSPPSRLPIHISAAGDEAPSGFKSGIRLDGQFLWFEENKGKLKYFNESTPDRGIYFSVPMEHLSQAQIGSELGEFLSLLQKLQEPSSQPYPEKPLKSEDLESYAEYIKSLLSYRQTNKKITPLCLSTIAISDELSNLPLGTAMVFSPQPLSYDTSVGISHICFDLLSAIYKIEQEASLLRETALLVTAWVHHETTHWSRYVSNQAGRVEEQVNDLNEVIGSDSERKKSLVTKQLRTIVTELLDVRENLIATAETATLTTELLTQLVGPSSSLIGIFEFENKVRTLLKLYSYVESELKTKCANRFPRAFLLVSCELIRNAVRHFSDKGTTTGKIKIRLEEELGALSLSVESEPHHAQAAESLEALNQLSLSVHANLDQLIKDNVHLGGFLIHMLVVVTGGHIRWTWKNTTKNRIRVKAIWNLNLPNHSEV